MIIGRTPTGSVDTALKKEVCKKVLSNKVGIPALKVWINTGSPADGFVEWTVSRAECNPLSGVTPF